MAGPPVLTLNERSSTECNILCFLLELHIKCIKLIQVSELHFSWRWYIYPLRFFWKYGLLTLWDYQEQCSLCLYAYVLPGEHVAWVSLGSVPRSKITVLKSKDIHFTTQEHVVLNLALPVYIPTSERSSHCYVSSSPRGLFRLWDFYQSGRKMWHLFEV